jgi:hypothetical protein
MGVHYAEVLVAEAESIGSPVLLANWKRSNRA